MLTWCTNQQFYTTGSFRYFARPTYPYPPIPPPANARWVPPSGSSSSYLPPPLPPPPPPLPHVEHEKAKTIKNYVNVHKDTIRLEEDESDKDRHLVSFTFDALVDGSITIHYFAKEEADCNFSGEYPDIIPVRVSFQKGVAQKFRQPSRTGIDLGFFPIDDLSKPSDGYAFPLVISAQASSQSLSVDEQQSQPDSAVRVQITLAVIEKKNDEPYRVKVIKQILWVEGERYELQELFGRSESEPEDDNSGQECVICMGEPRNTAVLPCRHVCMCSECAKALVAQSNKCPICRQPVEKLMEIKDKSGSL
ncbi:putative E3 ubiquitin-protein ligase LUL4 [Acorus calamus]|uniref:RING-type E3 ubiquitin transferase n=1 Tax=Acorus calamus TaxID=4465 RepID=A0AAV9EWB1_ACOCL|nr:putative E3 ubiquitin-protein ligase LUL4 [Acorus calamus]